MTNGVQQLLASLPITMPAPGSAMPADACEVEDGADVTACDAERTRPPVSDFALPNNYASGPALKTQDRATGSGSTEGPQLQASDGTEGRPLNDDDPAIALNTAEQGKTLRSVAQSVRDPKADLPKPPDVPGARSTAPLKTQNIAAPDCAEHPAQNNNELVSQFPAVADGAPSLVATPAVNPDSASDADPKVVRSHSASTNVASDQQAGKSRTLSIKPTPAARPTSASTNVSKARHNASPSRAAHVDDLAIGGSPDPVTCTAPDDPGECRAPDVSASSVHLASSNAGEKETASSPLAGNSPQGLHPVLAGGSGEPAREIATPSSSPNAENTSAKLPENAPVATAVQSARVLEQMGQSEMRVGVRTTDFGNIEVHTSLHQNRVDALIATAHPDLRSAMQVEFASLQHAMDRHQLQLDRLDLGSQHGGQGGSSSSGQQPRSSSGPSQVPRELASNETANPPPDATAWLTPHSSGISVIA